jgi:hypothetical protein
VYCAALIQVVSGNRRILNYLDLRKFTRLLAVFDPDELLELSILMFSITYVSAIRRSNDPCKAVLR